MYHIMKQPVPVLLLENRLFYIPETTCPHHADNKIYHIIRLELIVPFLPTKILSYHIARITSPHAAD